MVCKIIRQTLRPSGADDLRGFYSVHRASPHLSRNGLCACSIRHTPPRSLEESRLPFAPFRNQPCQPLTPEAVAFKIINKKKGEGVYDERPDPASAGFDIFFQLLIAASRLLCSCHFMYSAVDALIDQRCYCVFNFGPGP